MDKKNLTIKETFELAFQNHQQNNFQVAEKLYKDILNIDPNHFESIFLLGTLSAQNKNFEQAKQLLQKAIVINPNHPQAHYNLGLVFKDMKKVQKEKDCYERAIQINPDYADAHNNLGTIFQRFKEYLKAVSCYEKAIQINPNYANAYNNLGTAFQKLEKFQKAKGCYEKAIQIQPNYAEAYYNLGTISRKVQEIQKAISCYEKAIQINPNNASAHNNIGTIFMESGELQKAKDCYEKAIQIQSDHVDAHNNLGNIHRELGYHEKAISFYQKAIQINPNFESAHYNLGAIYKKLKKYQEAINSFQKINSTSSRAQLLESSYFVGDLKLYEKKLKELTNQDPLNMRVAAIAAYVSKKENIKNIYPFCKNPLKLILIKNIRNDLTSEDQFPEILLQKLKKIKAIWEPRTTTTTGGYQTYGNLFNSNDKIILKLKEEIKKQIIIYKRTFQSSEDYFIKKWPSVNDLQAWYVRLPKEGYQKAHLHPPGWLSGVFYIKVPKLLKKNEGGIKFQFYGYDYPADENLPKFIYSPKDLDLVLFPSSLFHETIPFYTNDERHCIAFDLLPIQSANEQK